MNDWVQQTNIMGPVGPVGPPGPGMVFKGQVATVGDLPTGASPGDAYTVLADGHMYVWDGTAWIDGGQNVGPPGPPGADSTVPGPQGPKGDTGPAGAADEIFIGPDDPGTGGTWEFWYDTDAPAIGGGGGGGIAPPPSDDGEYVMVNGVWRLKSKSLILDGVPSPLSIPVPNGAKFMKIAGSVHPAVGQGLVLRASIDGTIFLGSPHYTYTGFVHNTGTSGIVAYAETVGQGAMFITGTANVTTYPQIFTAEMNLVRGSTAVAFSLKSHGVSQSNDPTRLRRTAFFSNWIDPAATAALSVLAVQLDGGGSFGTGSTVEFTWVY